MNTKQSIIFGSLMVAVLTSAAVYAAQGARDGQNDAVALGQAKIGMTQAIAAAQKHAGGKVIRAELEDENGALVYGVEVTRGGKATDVKVSAIDGRIVSAQTDQADHEDGDHGRTERSGNED